MQIKIISAGAGSGKTYRLTHEMVNLLAGGKVRASGIVATTFTNKAAAELLERVRMLLIEKAMLKEANDLSNALIGTVHSLGVRLLKRFAFEAGVSPELDIIADEDHQMMFNQSLSMVRTLDRVEAMEQLSDRLGMNKSEAYKSDWRYALKQITEVARANDFSSDILKKCGELSVETFCQFLKPVKDVDARLVDIVKTYPDRTSYHAELGNQVEAAIQNLENSGDETKKTGDVIKVLKDALVELGHRGQLHWHHWAKISKLSVSVKSMDLVRDLIDFANSHVFHPSFKEDISNYLQVNFELGAAAIEEYQDYKKRRGLIDYTDMEVAVKNLLMDKGVQQVLASEIDLLMVDEFQDTNPIQLEIFLQLSRFAKQSIWVGDPKQSIYGFRGAEPALMEAIIKSQGGLKRENILEHSWRSRPDIVYFSNAVFTKAFSNLPAEQVVLLPKREEWKGAENCSAGFENALQHWDFIYDGDGRPNSDWMNRCIAEAIRQFLEKGILIKPKNEKEVRKAKAGDIAIFCRSNNECTRMAASIHQVGLQAAISRAGLLNTAEVRLLLACLRFILHRHDNLAIAEILILGVRLSSEELIESRFDFLDNQDDGNNNFIWELDNPIIQQLLDLRKQVVELSSTEILALLLEELDLRRIVATWGYADQRHANIEEVCRLAEKYENACMRLHSAASLGGFLLWLNELQRNENDEQGSGEFENAVNILTYHKSKGLEYPVVICHSLENKLKAELWGISIEHEKEEVDLNNILGHRWLRFWVNPYADQFRNTLLAKRLDESQDKIKKTKESLEEEARLLYVGLTRARDYLILPCRKNDPVWLNRVLSAGDEKAVVLPKDADAYFEWENEQVKMKHCPYTFSDDFQDHQPIINELDFLEKSSGKREHAPALTNLKDFPVNSYEISITEERDYGGGQEFRDSAFIEIARNFQLCDQKNLNQPLRKEIAARLISAAKEPLDLFANENLNLLSRGFNNWLDMEFSGYSVSRNFPIRTNANGGYFEFTIDFFLKKQTSIILILSISTTTDHKQVIHRIKEKAATLILCKEAAKAQFQGLSVDVWINVVSLGKVFKIVFDKKD